MNATNLSLQSMLAAVASTSSTAEEEQKATIPSPQSAFSSLHSMSTSSIVSASVPADMNKQHVQRIERMLASVVVQPSLVLPQTQKAMPLDYHSYLSNMEIPQQHSTASLTPSTPPTNESKAVADEDEVKEGRKRSGTAEENMRRIRRRNSVRNNGNAKKARNDSKEMQGEDSQNSMNTPDDPIMHSNAIAEQCAPQNPTGEGNSEDADADEALRRQKLCRVCGDNATGYNFNVVTCESCKAFFRRNALRNKEFKCPYNSECEINAVSRRFCQRCRLEKCVKVGMKKEWILNDEQLRRRKNSRLNSLKSHTPTGGMSYSSRSPSAISSAPQTPTDLMSSTPLAPEPNTMVHEVKAEMPEQYTNEMPNMRMPNMIQSELEMRNFLLNSMPNMMGTSGIDTPAAISPLVNAYSQASRLSIDMSSAGLLSPSTQSSSSLTSPASAISPSLISPEATYATNSLLRKIGERMGEHALRYDNLSHHSSRMLPLMPADIHLPPLPSSVETVVHRGEAKVALSVEEYHRLMAFHAQAQAQQHAASLPFISANKKFEVVVNGSAPRAVSPTTPASEAEFAIQDPRANSHGQIRSSSILDPQYTDAVAGVSAGGSSQIDMSAFSPDSLRRIKHMESTIHDALVNSPESLKSHPSPASAFHEAMTCGGDISNYSLNSAELRELDLVTSAFSCMDEPLELHAKAATPLKKRDHDPADVMNIMDVTMRRFVKMAKRLPTFNDLSQCGKLAMLKSAMIDMLTIRGVTRLNAEKHCWNTPVLGDANVSCNIFDKLNDCTQKNRFLHFCKMLHEKVRKNETAINLMGLVVLFDESRAIVDDKDKITARKHHDMYYNLLKRYVESLYGEEAPAMLETVPEALKELRTVSTNAATLFLGRVKPGETEQLPTEFFKTAPDESSTATSKPTVQTNLSEGETS